MWEKDGLNGDICSVLLILLLQPGQVKRITCSPPFLVLIRLLEGKREHTQTALTELPSQQRMRHTKVAAELQEEL